MSISEKRYNNSEDIKAMKINKNDEIIKTKEIYNTKIRIKESIVQSKGEPFEKIDRQVMNVSKSVCKLKIKTRENNFYLGTGFFLKFWIDQECFYCLLSNEHLLLKEIIKDDTVVYIYYDNEYKVSSIILDPQKRYIKTFNEDNLDITAVEILEEDNISKDYFLWDELVNINNKLLNTQVYIPQYAKGKDLVYAKGKIIQINKYEFTHLANTEYGSSGSPIFLENSINVIGIHKNGSIDKTENYGNFLFPAIKIIKNDINKKRNSGKYIDGKFVWEDGKYYIGEFKNEILNGKGIK